MHLLDKLIESYKAWANRKPVSREEVPVVQVDNIALKVAAFYERVRNIVGWTEEHLLRKTAIARILRRSLTLKKEGQSLADILIHDLVRGGYFPNGQIPQSKIPELDIVLNKYLFLFDKAAEHGSKDARELRSWLIGVAGCEVEAFLDPPVREEALLDFMTETMMERVQAEGKFIENEKENLIFISVRQALFKFDQPIITYQLIKKYIPNWDSLNIDKDKATLIKFGNDLQKWHEVITMAFRHSFLDRFYWAAEASDAPYLVLGDILSYAAKNNELAPEVLRDDEWLKHAALSRYKERLGRQRGKAFRVAFYSTLSIFLSKLAIAFAIELPFDRWTGQYSKEVLLFNIVIPPAILIIMLIFGLRQPPKKNSLKISDSIIRLINGTPSPYFIRLPKKRPLVIRGVIVLLYLLGGLATFGAIVYFLTNLHFSILSQAVFIFFFALIAYTGTQIRERSKELLVEEKPPGLIHDIFLFFFFPIVEAGRWFSGQLLKIRVVVFILDALVELPVKFFVEFIEQWRAFLKEKKQTIH